MNFARALSRRVALVVLLSAVAGCSSSKESAGDWFGGSNDKKTGAATGKKAAGKTETIAPVSGNPPVTGVSAATSGRVQPSDTAPPNASATAGLLLVNTSPSAAKVYLDNIYYGRSPLRIETELGEHLIAVKLEGYRMVTGKVSVRKGDNTKVEITLEQ